MLEKKIKNIILIIICLVMFVPIGQNIFHFFPEKRLVGVPDPASLPEFTLTKWLDGEFQSGFDNSVNENIGFRGFLIRLKNQIDYSIYRKANASGVIVGKNKTLFEWDYIREYIGRDFIGKEAIDKKFSRTRYIQQELKKKGVDLIFIFEPGKASFQPEDIPDRYRPENRSLTNYDYMRKSADSLGVEYLDLNDYFIQMKDTASYPLFTKGGTHWSIYGMNLAVDTLIKYIEKKRDIDMPDMKILDIEPSNIPRTTDNDLLKIMNLLKEPRKEEFGYPVVEYYHDSTKTRPRVYCVGDSFYLNLVFTGIPQTIFSYSDFMYYYHDTVYKEKVINPDDLLERTEYQDVILVMITERFLYKYAWGYIDDLYQLMSGEIDSKNDVYYYENRIRFDYKWFDKIIIQASNRGIKAEDFIRDNAEYMVFLDKQKDKQKEEQKEKEKSGLEKYINAIKSDSVWLDHVRQKAIKNNISLDSMIRLDAEWSLNQSRPTK
ncbi:hypothetical protein ACFLSI_03040 [Bacteroidota bacterium]